MDRTIQDNMFNSQVKRTFFNNEYIETLRKQLREALIRLKTVEEDCLKLAVALNFVSDRCKNYHKDIGVKVLGEDIILICNGINIKVTVTDKNLFLNECYICLSSKNCLKLDCNHNLCPECLIAGEGVESMKSCGICRSDIKRKII